MKKLILLSFIFLFSGLAVEQSPCILPRDICLAPGDEYLLLSNAQGVYGPVALSSVLVGGNADGYLDSIVVDANLQQVSFLLSESINNINGVDFSAFTFDNELSNVALSGDFDDLTNRPILTQSGGNIEGNIDLQNLTFTLTATNSGAVSYYDSGFGFWVYGSAGVVTTSSGAGVYDMSFPNAADISFWYKEFTNAGSETNSGTVIVNQDWNTSSFNTSRANALQPTYSMHWEGLNGEQFPPQNTDTSPINTNATGTTIRTSAVQNGVLTTIIENIDSAIPIATKGNY